MLLVCRGKMAHKYLCVCVCLCVDIVDVRCPLLLCVCVCCLLANRIDAIYIAGEPVEPCPVGRFSSSASALVSCATAKKPERKRTAANHII